MRLKWAKINHVLLQKNAVYAITDDSFIKRYPNVCQFCFNAQILFKIQLLKNFIYVNLVFMDENKHFISLSLSTKNQKLESRDPNKQLKYFTKKITLLILEALFTKGTFDQKERALSPCERSE